MNMKYVKIKFILPALLIIALCVAILMFFVGALKPYEYVLSDEEKNIEVNFDDYSELLDYSTYTAAEYDKVGTKLVGQNDKYFMVIDEKSTIVSVYEKGANWNEANPMSNASLVLRSADSESTKSEHFNNFYVNYINSINKEGRYDSILKSISYKNRINNKDEHHYKIGVNQEEDYVDVIYEVGEFTYPDAYFPKYLDRQFIENLFFGNMLLITEDLASHKLKSNGAGALVDNGKNSSGEMGRAIVYTGNGVTFSDECAEYLEDNGVTVSYNETKKYWNLSDIKNPDGTMKVFYGDGINTENSPCNGNPFMTQNMLSDIFQSIYLLIQKEEGSDKQYINEFLYLGEDASPYYRKGDITVQQSSDLNNVLYPDPSNSVYLHAGSKNPAYFDKNNDGFYTEDEKFVYGGFQKFTVDEETGKKIFEYDDNGNPIQDTFKKEYVEEQNELFNYKSEEISPIFQIGIRFELKEDGMKCYLLGDLLQEGKGNGYKGDSKYAHDYKITSIELLPYVTQNTSEKSEGNIVIPDGSGAIISFNSEKSALNVAAYPEKRIYGSDRILPQERRGNFSQDITLPMYGFIEKGSYNKQDKAIIAIVEKGAGQTSIAADFLRDSNPNYARFKTYLRESEDVKVSSGKVYRKYSNDLYNYDICYNYIIKTGKDLTYVDVAEAYRDYLGLELNDQTKESTLSINFLGAYTKKDIRLGFVYDSERSLTTFKQAGEIVKDLYANGVSSLNAVYTNWTEDEGSPEITTDFTVSDALGGKKQLKSFSKLMQELAFDVYYDYNVTNGYGYDYSYGSLKYSSKSISNAYSTAASYVLSTGLIDNSRKSGNIISPRFYHALISEYAAKANKNGATGLSLHDLGNARYSDYSKNDVIYSDTAILYQKDALKIANEKLNGKVLLSSPYIYAIPFASYASNVPTTSTLYPIVDYSVPLYQLVISGCVDYSSEFVNYENDNDMNHNILKAIETGSNLSFLLSYENTNNLLDTSYTEFYNAYYLNWRTKIIKMNNILNETGIYESYLISHKTLDDNVVEVEYENGLRIIINYGNETYQDLASGFAVAGNWFTVVEEGDK